MAETLHAIIQQARQRLDRAGIDPVEGALDAELLARHALGGWDKGRLLASWREPAPVGFSRRFEPLVIRRERREPTAYIIGHREFWGLEIAVAPGVLIPRPETECIVEEALTRVAKTPDQPPSNLQRGPAQPVVRFADVGTGSGCLAIALALAIPAARVAAIDMSSAALTIAAANVARHRVGDRVHLVRSSLLDAIAGPLDLIVSNPPYIPSGDLAALQPEIRNYEPALALASGTDGLDAIRRLVPMAAARLAVHGWLMFEIGHGQAGHVQAILDAEPRLAVVAWRDDLAGIPRVVVARRQ
ncbi:MAG: peptide chain release factor N(5)-glutamine methyltransferase [Acidobacteriota bacterium]